MRLIFPLLLILVSFHLPLFGQSDKDYEVVNRILNKDSTVLNNQGIYFKSSFDLAKEAQSKPMDELFDWYKSMAEYVLKDTLSRYKSRITKRRLKGMFVKLELPKIQYSLKSVNDTNRYLYLSKPLRLKKDVYLIIQGDFTGTLVIVYSVTSNSVETVKLKRIRRIGIMFR